MVKVDRICWGTAGASVDSWKLRMQMFRPEKVFSQKNTQTYRLRKSIMSSTTQMKSTQAIGKKPQLQLGFQGKAVLELEQLLTKLGVYRQPAQGIFNQAVQFAVKLFQFRFFLPPDGIVGPLTKAGALYWSSS